MTIRMPPIQLVSCQLAVHYFFRSQETASGFFQNAVEKLAPRGFLLLTTVRADELVSRTQAALQKRKGEENQAQELDPAKGKAEEMGHKKEEVSFGNALYRVSFPSFEEAERAVKAVESWSDHERSSSKSQEDYESSSKISHRPQQGPGSGFGHGYRFSQFASKIDSVEYLVPPGLLLRLCEEQDLDLLEERSFESVRSSVSSLLRRRGAEGFAAAGKADAKISGKTKISGSQEKEMESEDGFLEEAARLVGRYTKQHGGMELSADEEELCGLYTVIVLRKRGTREQAVAEARETWRSFPQGRMQKSGISLVATATGDRHEVGDPC